MNFRRSLALLATLIVSACASYGPTTITRDRFDYSGAVAESWKNQMLMNLVKMRYYDLPIYLDVGQIVSGYTLETQVSGGGQIARAGAGETFLGFGAQGTFTDRPTITYTPLTGQKYLESFLTPIHMAKVLSLIQAGFPADLVLELGADSLNGLRNRPISPDTAHAADPDFFRILALLRELQDAGVVGVRVERQDGKDATIIFFRQEHVRAEILQKVDEVRHLLRLDPDLTAFRLVSSPARGGRGELTVTTRSLMQTLRGLALGVDVPPAHQKRRLTAPTTELPPGHPPLVHIQSGPAKPDDVFIAVLYEGQWFWIANDDWRSKRTFSGLLFLFTLADMTSSPLPVLTIPAQ